MEPAVVWGLLVPFLGTSLGSACVFFLKRELGDRVQRGLTGFASGVMVAASVWSLLIPAIEEGEAAGTPGWLPAVGGFVLGVGFLLLLVISLLSTDEDHEHDGTIPTTEHEEGGAAK